MPYIAKELNIAKELRKLIDCGSKPDNPGELNYLITCLCRDYIEQKGKRYLILNEVVGALECAKLELYRRVAAPYEDEKIAENGDVYPVS